MALSNRDRVNRGMDLLRAGLLPFVTDKERAKNGPNWFTAFKAAYPMTVAKKAEDLDLQGLLKLMREGWNGNYSENLGITERNLVHELLDNRNKWAHQAAFSRLIRSLSNRMWHLRRWNAIAFHRNRPVQLDQLGRQVPPERPDRRALQVQLV